MAEAIDRELLLDEARRINSPEFISQDPVQFPRRFSRQQDIEIAALLSATIAWGNRKMICRDAERLFQWMEWAPYDFVMEGAYEKMDAQANVHRTFFVRNLQHYLRGLHSIYRSHATLDAFAASANVGASEYPAWEFATALGHALTDANAGRTDSQCVPGGLETTALKRINMALRWLVRDDGIVDLGIWKSIRPAQLFIPLDVHAGRVARELGLLNRRSNDRKAVDELTRACRLILPHDPALLDFALFGIGIESKQA